MNWGIRMRAAAAFSAGLSASLLASLSAIAAGPAIDSGRYLYVEGGSAHGVLSIKGNAFDIETMGSNCHTCALSGTLEGRVGIARDGDNVCRIAVSGGHGAVKLDTSGSDACRDFCGMRASFDGEYRRPGAACTDRARDVRTERSHKQYAAHDYDAARATLKSLLDECSGFMGWIELDRAKSDLALTEYHRGDRAQCVSVLSDTVAYRAQQDHSEAFGLPPCDADNYQSTGDAILHNLALCRAPAKR
ncbi:hypothetical protein BTM_2240 [Burkholderia thailandensis 34]|nr:hypothetical protein BTM_2240 [Burkholderia thailandensis 34]PNE74821.1 hypothetical protein A8H37_24045 [Burkholderia thailandensis]